MFGKIRNWLRKKKLKSLGKKLTSEPKNLEEILENLNLYLKETQIDSRLFTTKATAPLSDLDILNKINFDCVVDYDNEVVQIRVFDILQYFVKMLTGKELMLSINSKGFVTKIEIDDREEEQPKLTD